MSPMKYLPYDMVGEIFSHLPAKQICKFRCVNRFINNMTSTVTFASRQFFNVRAITSGLLIQEIRMESMEFFLLGEDDDVGIPAEIFLSGTDTFIVGCNNGIIVYDKKLRYHCNGDLSFQVFILNPVTLQRRSLPRLVSNSSSFLLGSVMIVGDQQEDYNLVCFLSTGEWDNQVEYHVYSSKTSRWMEESKRKFNVGSRNLKYERPILVRKKIYFVSDCHPSFGCEPYVVAIDIEQGSSKIQPLPVLDLISSDHRIEIANWGDSNSSLCLLRWCDSNSTFTIWIMEDENKWTWSKFTVEISTKDMGLERLPEKGDVTCFTLINGCDMVFNIGSVMHVYRLKDGRTRKLKKEFSGGYVQLFPYSNTLCPI